MVDKPDTLVTLARVHGHRWLLFLLDENGIGRSYHKPDGGDGHDSRPTVLPRGYVDLDEE